MKIAGKPLLLMILDGWGLETESNCNALHLAKIPNFRRLRAEYPHAVLNASGLSVGLPEGQMGNSEVGHMNIGAGRIIYQDFTKINKSIADGDFYQNQAFLAAINHAKTNHTALHLLGLMSDGGIHSHINHFFALLQMAKEQGLERVFVHCFTDGRDTDSMSAQTFIADLNQEMTRLDCGKIATVVGRYYAMDRDQRWERVAKAYHCLVGGQGVICTDVAQAVQASYEQNITDEFIEPIVVADANGQTHCIANNDSVIFVNFRSDRAREISHALCDQDFTAFNRGANPPQVYYVCCTHYDDLLQKPIAFPNLVPQNTLGHVLAENHLRQLRIAETEKYAHVTFFFNGGAEEPEQGEDRILIPSPKVATYDLQPEMSAEAVTAALLAQIEANLYDVIILNYANPDMVGHTGKMAAAIKAVEFIDSCLGQVASALQKVGGTLLITADHGNVDEMLNPDLSPMTAHTLSPVPLIVVDDNLKGLQLADGNLENIAPTILDLLGLAQPLEMSGHSLVK